MRFGFKELKDQVSNLAEADFERFAQWFSRLREQRAYQRRCNTKGGISSARSHASYSRVV